ncbi:MAG TPA: succinate dehydrogenase [Methylomirabilota bacterium]|nr:succinate dehydrogenase [Methylomirabilota bacterium]
MDTVLRLWRSTVGRKALVAASGLLLGLWVVLHVAGNLTVFSGPAAADGYAASLRRMPAALWAIRIGLVLAAVVHVAGVVSLTRADRAARPRRQARATPRASTWAARGMRVGGALLLGFVIFHLLHLTFGVAHPGFLPGHVYDNVVRGLHSPLMAAIYIGAALVLGLHLFHGLWAAVRSLGVRPEGANRRRRPAVAALSAAVALGFAAVPLAVVAGWLR